MNLYTNVLRPCLFRLDAETAHHLTLDHLAWMPPSLVRGLVGVQAALPTALFGLSFPNPVGLAAGLDKNAVALPAWEAMGFGFAEVGTITAQAQPGNPKPRLFRYPDLEGLINRFGFNNDGAEVVRARLQRLQDSGRWPRIPIGINIGKSKVTELADAPSDYLFSYQKLYAFGDYFVVNVSSPNTPGLRSLQSREALLPIFRALRDWEGGAGKPLLVKIAPDLASEDVEEIARLAEEEKLAGIIATNTTVDHQAVPSHRDETGGLSGRPLTALATATLRQLRQLTDLPIIASGGVMDEASAAEKRKAGASLVQIYTGFVYRGPSLITEICRAWADAGE